MAELNPEIDDDSVFIIPGEEEEQQPGARVAGPGKQRANILRSLHRHKMVAIVMLVLAGLIGGILVYLRAIRPLYSAESQILISPIFPKNLIEDREYQVPRYEEFVNQQLAMVVREEVVGAALESLGESSTLWIRPGEGRREAAGRLSGALIAKRVPNTSYLSIGLEGRSPKGLAEIVNAVTQAYLLRVRSEIFFGQTTTLEALGRHKKVLEESLGEKTKQLEQWTQQFGIAGFEPKAIEMQPVAADRAVSEARSKRIEAGAKLAVLISQQEGKRPDLFMEARDQLSSDPELNSLKVVLLTRKNELKSKLLGLTPQHEGRRLIERTLADIDSELDRAEKSAFERIRSSLEQRMEARLRQERQTLQSGLEDAKRYEDALTADLTLQAEKLARINLRYYEIMGVRQEVERLTRQRAAVEDRMDAMRLETQAPSFVRLVSPATFPEAPVPRPLLGLIVAVALGAVGLAVGVPMLLERMDHRVRSPVDLEPILNHRPLGWILERRPQTESFVREQIRRIALSLERERRLYNRSHFVFTSLRPGGGTSRLVLDLARDLQALGIRTIMIEANVLHPDPRLAGADGHPGLMDVLEGKAPIGNAILPAQGSLPDLVPIGNTQGRKQLSGCRNVRPLLDRLIGRYEIILIDAPPILFSSDAELLASGAHAAVLVVEAERTDIGEVHRAVQIMRQLGPPLIQVVVNRVRDSRGLGYYSELVEQYEAAGRARTS
jgi:succinoglycan biosynthesis transport protein ExoP